MDKELQAWALIYGLNNPLIRYNVQRDLIALGGYAMNSLITFLITDLTFEHEPRCLAAEALGIIGNEEAINGLITALTKPFNVVDPALKLEEEAVRDCICHALQYSGNKKAIEPLMFALERYHFIGAAEALAAFKERRAIPILITMLEDSFKRTRVSDSIMRFGSDAIEELIKTTVVRRIEHGCEVLPSIERRAEAIRLLGLIGDKKVAALLVDLLDDEQVEVRFETAVSLVTLLQKSAPQKAIKTIKSLLNNLSLEKKLRAQEVLQ